MKGRNIHQKLKKTSDSNGKRLENKFLGKLMEGSSFYQNLPLAPEKRLTPKKGLKILVPPPPQWKILVKT